MMKNKIYSLLFVLTIFWMSSGMWLVHSGVKKLTAFCIILLVFCLITKSKLLIHNIKRPAIITLLAFTLLVVLTKEIHGGIFGSFQRALICLYIISICFDKNSINPKSLHYTLVLSALVHCTYIYYSVFHLHQVRPTYIMNPNMYAPVFGGLLCYFSYHLIKSHSKVSLLITISMILGVVLMQSRGVLLASCVVFSIYIFYFLAHHYTNWKSRLIIISPVILIGIILINTTTFEKLINKSYREYVLIEKGNLNTSIGLRIQMQLIGMKLIKDKPIIGHGDSFDKKRLEVIKNEGYHPILSRYNTLHNVYLDSWAKVGIGGFIAMLSFTILPWIILRRYQLGILGLGLSSFTFIISLVDTALIGGSYMLLLYIITLTSASYLSPNINITKDA